MLDLREQHEGERGCDAVRVSASAGAHKISVLLQSACAAMIKAPRAACVSALLVPGAPILRKRCREEDEASPRPSGEVVANLPKEKHVQRPCVASSKLSCTRDLAEDAASTTETLAHWRELEALHTPGVQWALQDEITPQMRLILVDWLFEVCCQLRLMRETFFLAVSYLDRFLTAQKVPRMLLQLVGVSCLWLASKYEEVSPPPAEVLAEMTDNSYTTKQLCSMEASLLSVLNWQMGAPTPLKFLDLYVSVLKLKALSSHKLALHLLEIGCLASHPANSGRARVPLRCTTASAPGHQLLPTDLPNGPPITPGAARPSPLAAFTAEDCPPAEASQEPALKPSPASRSCLEAATNDQEKGVMTRSRKKLKVASSISGNSSAAPDDHAPAAEMVTAPVPDTPSPVSLPAPAACPIRSPLLDSAAGTDATTNASEDTSIEDSRPEGYSAAEQQQWRRWEQEEQEQRMEDEEETSEGTASVRAQARNNLPAWQLFIGLKAMPPSHASAAALIAVELMQVHTTTLAAPLSVLSGCDATSLLRQARQYVKLYNLLSKQGAACTMIQSHMVEMRVLLARQIAYIQGRQQAAAVAAVAAANATAKHACLAATRTGGSEASSVNDLMGPLASQSSEGGSAAATSSSAETRVTLPLVGHSCSISQHFSA